MNSGQGCADYWQSDRHHLWHPYTRQSSFDGEPFPMITKGEGIYLYDSAGNRYLDAISSWWACNLGHSEPRIVSAIVRQAQELQHSILGNLSHPRAVELAEKLTGLFPDDRHVLFASDGASSVEAALKVAVQYWYNRGCRDRCKFVSLENGYHGDTLGAVSVGRIESFHRQFDALLFPAFRVEAPCCSCCKYGKSPDSCKIDCSRGMADVFAKHGNELAAAIVEPLCQGAAGIRIYPPRYLEKLHELCRKHEVLLIVDEIAMGMGRTGRMFAFEHAGIMPDIVCIGKGLSGGYLPISATVVKGSIFDTFKDDPDDDRTFYHGHTFAGNPIAAAAALETLAIYKERDVVAIAAEKGDLFKEAVPRFSALPHVVDVRSLGMIFAVELDEPASAQEVKAQLLGQGVMTRPLGAVVYLMPPLVTPPDILISTLDLLHAAVSAL